jgi:parallel beta-helix repeat protein
MATTAAEQIDLGLRRPKRRRWGWIAALMIALLIAVVFALSLWPVRADFAGSEGTAGVDPSGVGLRKPFPSMVVRADNPLANEPGKDERVALGRLLFFDPVLSGDNDISCATCHHPDLGLADGRGFAMGRGGRGLGAERAGGSPVKRGAPSIWNAGYYHLQFWDGRSPDLEDQAQHPIKSEIEMAENPERLVAELKAIPEYVERFGRAFKGGPEGDHRSSVTFDNIARAVAAFERTLLANDSPFDRYLHGDLHALTPEQKRGFNLFRSGKTRCFECHGLPTFANRDFKVIGVPEVEGQEADGGRFEVTKGEGNRGAFKVPTLRNVALNAPYMHNGKFKTLEEVIDFYARGGGPGAGVATPNLDDKVRPYTITKQEKADLIAFLFALTDESKLPPFPERVPSGLPVVTRLENPARALVAKYNTGAPPASRIDRPPATLQVKAGESIQAAIDRARPGDTIEVEPGRYHEELTIDLDQITLRGKRDQSPFEAAKKDPGAMRGAGEPRWPILDGRGALSDAVIATGSNFVIEGFEIRHYLANGVQVQHAYGPVFRDLYVEDTGLYGTYPVSCTGVTIERVAAHKIADAAIYVGQSRQIVVRDCIAFGNVTGIEIENSVNALVENNHVYDNTGGILVFLLPNNVSKVGRDAIVRNNRVIENNHPNFGNPHSIVGRVPPGGGILVMAADNTEVTGNEIRGNHSYGVAVTSLEVSFPKGTSFDVGPTPENNWIHDNVYADNGAMPAASIAKLGLKGADLLWDLSGWSNRWSEPRATRATPVIDAGWPALARRAYWRALTFAARYL